jgi:rhodanese-related sulfurtransferase
LLAVRDLNNAELLPLLEQGISVLDVRTPAEFLQGHIPGASNVPVAVVSPQGQLGLNPAFAPTVQACFQADSPLIIHCQSGVRSRQAGKILAQLGYSALLHLPGGFGGGRDPFGAKIAGYIELGHPIATATERGRSYEELMERAGTAGGQPHSHERRPR